MASNPGQPRNVDTIKKFAEILAKNDPKRAAFYTGMIESDPEAIDIPFLKMIDRGEYNNQDPRDHPPVLEHWQMVEQTDINQLETSSIKKHCILLHRLRALSDMLPLQREHTLVYEQKLSHTINRLVQTLIFMWHDIKNNQIVHDDYDTAYFNAKTIIDDSMEIPNALVKFIDLLKQFDTRRADWYMTAHRCKKRVSQDPQVQFIINGENSGLSLEKWVAEEKHTVQQSIHNVTDIKLEATTYMRTRCLLGIFHWQNIAPDKTLYYNKLIQLIKDQSANLNNLFSQEGHQHEVWDGRIKPVMWARNIVNAPDFEEKIHDLEPLPDRPHNMDANVSNADEEPEESESTQSERKVKVTRTSKVLGWNGLNGWKKESEENAKKEVKEEKKE